MHSTSLRKLFVGSPVLSNYYIARPPGKLIEGSGGVGGGGAPQREKQFELVLFLFWSSRLCLVIIYLNVFELPDVLKTT